MDKKLTDNEIIKALECCANWEGHEECRKCPFEGGCEMNQLEKRALDLINRLQADCENYKKIAEHQQSVTMDRGFEIKRLKEKVGSLQAENEELKFGAGLRNNRKYYRKFVDEVYSKQKGKELSSPDFDYIYQLYFEQQAEIERLKAKVNHYNYCYDNFVNKPISRIKAEAYKECIEMVKENSNKMDLVCSGALVQRDYTITEQKLDNLLKELVGEDKDSAK